MNKQLAYDFSLLRVADQEALLADVGIPMHKGKAESDQDWCKRVLTEVDKAGKIREFESLLNSGGN